MLLGQPCNEFEHKKGSDTRLRDTHTTRFLKMKSLKKKNTFIREERSTATQSWEGIKVPACTIEPHSHYAILLRLRLRFSFAIAVGIGSLIHNSRDSILPANAINFSFKMKKKSRVAQSQRIHSSQ